jgi:hypothetical protein
LEIIKSVAMPLIWLVILIINVGALWKWNSSFVKKKDFDPKDYIKAASCKACKENMQVADKEVREDLRNIKTTLVEEERYIKTLGVIQIVMCRHIGMKKEEVDMFKDAIMNGADLTSLL